MDCWLLVWRRTTCRIDQSINPVCFSTLQPASPPHNPAHPQASDCPHLANERIRRLNLVRGKNVVKNLLVEVGQAAAGAGSKQNGGLANGGMANGGAK